MKQLTEADKSACHPQDIGNQRWKDECAAYYVPVFFLEGVHHRHILVLSHWLGKEKTTWRKKEKDVKKKINQMMMKNKRRR